MQDKAHRSVMPEPPLLSLEAQLTSRAVPSCPLTANVLAAFLSSPCYPLGRADLPMVGMVAGRLGSSLGHVAATLGCPVVAIARQW